MPLLPRRRCCWWVGGLLLVCSVVACNSNTEFGSTFLPGAQLQLLTNIQPTVSTNLKAPVLRTDAFGNDLAEQAQGNLPQVMVGSLADPYLGRTTATAYLEMISTSSDTTSFGYNVIADSAALLLKYSSAYGDPTLPQTLYAYEIADSLGPQAHYSNDSVAVTGNEITGGFKLYTSSIAAAKPTLRIPVKLSFAQHLLNLTAEILNSQANIRQNFSGLQLRTTPATGLGSIFTFDLSSYGNAVLRVYYHHQPTLTAAIATDSLNLYASGGGRHFTSLRRTGSTGSLYSRLVAQDTTVTSQYAVVQGGFNVTMLVGIPAVPQLRTGGTVNDAVLQLSVDPSTWTADSLFRPPDAVNVYRASSDSLTEDVNSFLGQAHFNLLNQTYSFSLQGYFRLLNRGTTLGTGIVVVPPFRHSRPYRVIFAGSKHPNVALRPTLRIYYTPAP